MHTDPDLLALLAMGEVVGTTDDHEHLATCAGCRAELAELTRIVGVGQRSDPSGGPLVAPPDHVWTAVRRELGLLGSHPETNGHQHPAVPLTAPTPSAARPAIHRPAPRKRAAQFVLAAAVALIAGLGGGIIAQQPEPVAGPILRAKMNALPAWPGATGEAVVEQDASGARFLVVSVQSPTPPPGTQEVWVSDTSAYNMHAMGKLTDGEGRFLIPAGWDLKATPVVDISVEPDGDTDPHHSGESMLRCRLPV